MAGKSAEIKSAHSERTVSTYCYQCVAGPDLLKVRIEDDIATEIAPNFDAAAIHPAGGKVCVKAFGLVQKAYTPNRVLRPMKRTNPRKGRDEDPGWSPHPGDRRGQSIIDACVGGGFLPDAGRATGIAWMLGIGRFGGIAGSFLVAELTARQLTMSQIFAVVAVPGFVAALALVIKHATGPENAPRGLAKFNLAQPQ